MKKRFFIAIKKYLIILSVLVAYLIWIFLTDIKIPCITYKITGFQCPSCGITRMFLAILKFDFVSAFNYNAYIFVNLPFVAICILATEINYIKNNKYDFRILKYILIVELIGFVIFGILRNFLPYI